VTLDLLWQEYKGEHPTLVQQLLRPLSAGWTVYQPAPDACPRRETVCRLRCPTVPVTEPLTGEIRQAAIFVAVPAPRITPTAMPPGARPCRTGLVAMSALAFFGGVPTGAGPDNLKSGVNKACFYDFELNPAIVTWPSITPPPSCRPGRIARKTRPRRRPASCSSNAGSWPDYATSASSVSANSIGTSPN
jgi:hypothetical protein